MNRKPEPGHYYSSSRNLTVGEGVDAIGIRQGDVARIHLADDGVPVVTVLQEHEIRKLDWSLVREGDSNVAV